MGTPFRNFDGVVAPLPLDNIDTDAIIPSPWLRSAHRDFSAGLFADWRRDPAGRRRQDFVLNQPRYAGATILAAGDNFGCGSSREAAAWALRDAGFRCILAPGFSDIFAENAFLNGLLAARILREDLSAIVALAEAAPDDAPAQLHIDLSACRVVASDGREVAFDLPSAHREALLRGDDMIALSLRHEAEIERFFAAACTRWPWMYAPLDAGCRAPQAEFEAG